MQVTDEMVAAFLTVFDKDKLQGWHRDAARAGLEAALADVPDRQPLPGPGARPETLEACWAVIEMMDVEVLGAMNDLDAAKTRVKELEAQLAKVRSWREVTLHGAPTAPVAWRQLDDILARPHSSADREKI